MSEEGSAQSSIVAGLTASGDTEQAFKESVAALAAGLGKRRGPRAFSEEAVRELAIQQANFLEDVGLDAINRARRNQADFISASDVRAAEGSLRSRPPTFPARLLEPAGGLIAGAGLAQLYAVLSAPKSSPPSTLGYFIAAVSTIIGIALLAFGLARR